jgi:hypothetical protein
MGVVRGAIKGIYAPLQFAKGALQACFLGQHTYERAALVKHGKNGCLSC